MTRNQLTSLIRQRRSFLCVGLDTDPARIPAALRGTADPVFAFNKAIIDATAEFCIAYKPNIAFYEAQGPRGWESLARTLEYIGSGHFTIADAKRGDIGNSSARYAETFFRTYAFDAVTVAPYMGHDSVAPFLAFPGKWTVLLALTSNPGADDFQKPGDLYERVLQTSASWGTPDNLMYVVGATQAGSFRAIRAIVPNHFLLVPGIGAQGGDLESIAREGLTPDGGLIVNVSRDILYASDSADFAERAGARAAAYRNDMAGILDRAGLA